MEAKEVKQYTFCLRCERRLRSLSAKQLGYGRICYEKSKSEKQKKKLFT